MKAHMNAEGVITLKAESSMEVFALRQWVARAEETVYIDVPGYPTRKPKVAWSAASLVVDDSVPVDGAS